MGRLPLALIIIAATVARVRAADTIADREAGQPDFVHNQANLPDADVLSHPYLIAIDKSVTPNRLYVADHDNSRILGYHDVAALVSGQLADLVVGQPDPYSAGANFNGVSRTSLNNPKAVAVDNKGNLFVADTNNSRVLEYKNPFAELAASGMDAGFPAIAVLGQGQSFTANGCNLGGSGSGAETLCNPGGLAFDSRDNLYVADSNNNRVLEYNAPFSTAFAANRVFGQLGSFTSSSPNNGGITANSLNAPGSVTLDAMDNLYVADSSNNRVLEYYTPLKVTTVKGSGDTTADRVFGQIGSFTTNGGGTSATTSASPQSVALDRSGDVFIADTGNNRLLEFTPPIGSNPTATRVFGQAGGFTSGMCGTLEGFPNSATLCNPNGVAVDSNGNLFASDTNENRVLQYKPPFPAYPFADLVLGQIDMVHQTTNLVDPASMNSPQGIVVDGKNHVYVADVNNNRVLGYKSMASFISTVPAGISPGVPADLVIGQPDLYSGNPNQLSGSPSERTLYNPAGLAVDASGNLYVADRANNRVLVFGPPFSSGVVASQAAFRVYGQGGSFTSTSPNSQGGVSKNSLNGPTGVTIDKSGRLYVADQGNNRVLQYFPASNTTAVVVIGQNSFIAGACNLGGGANKNTLCSPADVAVDAVGNLYVADRDNHRVLEYNNAQIKTGANAALVFGTCKNFTGGSCPTTSADSLNTAQGVAVDSNGDLYAADSNRVLEYLKPLAAGGTTAKRVFGQLDDFTSNSANLGGATPDAQTLSSPMRIAVDGFGNLYISDSNNNRVLEYNGPFTTAATPRIRASRKHSH